MPNKKTLASMIAVLAVICGFLTATPALAASKVKVLYSFKDNGADGRAPMAGLIRDTTGNLYGTTVAGGVNNMGTVFELSHGTWAEKILYTFTGGVDGGSPAAALIFDSSGNLYGTTVFGGAKGGYGTVFELTPGAGGAWTETVLHSFSDNHTDGYYPFAGVIFDPAGNLYGATSGGGIYGNTGTVFQLTPGAGGWAETLLYGFEGHDGSQPYGSLILDTAGNLYGTTSMGGHKPCCDAGTAFELTPGAGGWTETLLYSFERGDFNNGDEPYAGLIFDASGNLYGTTSEGGAYPKPCGGAGCGTVFRLTPRAGGGWKQTEIHSFGHGTDGLIPEANLIFGASGNLYGTTTMGGAYKNSCGADKTRGQTGRSPVSEKLGNKRKAVLPGVG